MTHSLQNITENRPDEERTNLLNLVANDAANYLGVSLENDSPEHILSVVNECVRDLRRGEKSVFPEDEEYDLLLGCLWATQMIRVFNWEWADITFHEHGDSEAVGLVSPDRGMAIYPFHFIYGCIENKATVTILLAFNMLKERVDEIIYPPKSYENIMDSIHHIIPPED